MLLNTRPDYSYMTTRHTETLTITELGVDIKRDSYLIHGDNTHTHIPTYIKGEVQLLPQGHASVDRPTVRPED